MLTLSRRARYFAIYAFLPRRYDENVGFATNQGLDDFMRRREFEPRDGVGGLPNPARDSRTVVLARRAMHLKRSDRVLIESGAERILLRLGEHARARVDGETRRSVAPIDNERLRAVETQGGSLAELLGLAA